MEIANLFYGNVANGIPIYVVFRLLGRELKGNLLYKKGTGFSGQVIA